MVFKKCTRCGEFHVSEENLCKICLQKDLYDEAKVKDYIDSAITITSMGEISNSTGVSMDTLERIKSNDNLEKILSKI